MEKMTKKESFTAIEKILTEMGNTELAGVMAHEIELLNRKSSSKKENAEHKTIMDLIINELTEVGRPITVTELLTREKIASFTTSENKKLTNQKVSALMTKLKNSGEVVRTEEKGIAYFAISE